MKLFCSKCGSSIDENNFSTVDGESICNTCMYGNIKPFALYPIGRIRNTQRRSSFRFGIKNKSSESVIELFESQKAFMYKLEEEKTLTIIYYLHEARPVKSVFRRGLDGKKVGVFASRTPDRLSRLAVQDVVLVKIEGTAIFVEGLDAIDGTPVVDIKMGRA